MGFAYWAYAAHFYSQQAVGYGSAGVSAITLLGTIGMFGLGTMLIGELPRRRNRAGLVSASLIVAGFGSLVLGLVFATTAPLFSSRFQHITGSAEQIVIFVVGVAVTAVGLVFDQATIGLLRGGLQLSRNVVFAVAKLAALPLTAVIAHDAFGTGITASFVAGTVVSLLLIAIRISWSGTFVFPRPDWSTLRGLGRVTLAHNWLNIAIAVTPSIMPVLVTIVVSPAATAVFYVAFMLSNFLYIITSSLSTVLFAVAAEGTAAIAGKLRFTLWLSLLAGIPGMLALGFAGHFVLSLFGADYAKAGTFALWTLVLGYLPLIPVAHYIAVCRATGRVSRAAALLTVATVVEIGAAAVGGAVHGLDGLSVALLAAKVLEGLVTTPEVLRVAMSGGLRQGMPAQVAATRPTPVLDNRHGPGYGEPQLRAHRPGTVPGHAPAFAESSRFGPVSSPAESMVARQQAGIAALEAIAVAVATGAPVGSTGPIPIMYATARMPPASNGAGRPGGAHRSVRVPDAHRHYQKRIGMRHV